MGNFLNKKFSHLYSDGEKDDKSLPPSNPHLFFSAAMGPQRESRLAEQRRLRRLRAWRRAIMKVCHDYTGWIVYY